MDSNSHPSLPILSFSASFPLCVSCSSSSISQPIEDHKPPSNSPLRIRPAAHLVTDEYLAKYKKAVRLMKALPDDDPRNFIQQANIHRVYCHGGAHHRGWFLDPTLQVHSSWLFFPFHRWYIYFYERILGSLIGDPTFALPFWNWDNPPGMKIPAIYTDKESPLYDRFRNQSHQPPVIIDLEYQRGHSGENSKNQIQANLKTMHRQVVTNGGGLTQFLGERYLAGSSPNPGAGSLEQTPHNNIHNWTGDPRQPQHEDMGDFYSAARDPIFFAHHSNVDRMWNIWKTKVPGDEKDFTDDNWLESSFLFYDENKKLVRVKIKDCLDSERLGYDYQSVETPWLEPNRGMVEDANI